MAVDKPLQGGMPAWALALQALGWVIVAAGVLAAAIGLFTLAPRTPEGHLVLVPLAIALASLAAWIGGIPIVIAKAARCTVLPPHWRLWAKIMLQVGGIFCVSIPSAVYGILPAGLRVERVMRSSADAFAAISPLDPELMLMTLIVGGPFFMIGLGFILPALIWGRYKSTPDVPAVFS